MLRMISVSGIALAMVIGFVVLSRQMRDDFDVRKQVYEGAVYMKHLADAQLQCAKNRMPEPVTNEAQQNDELNEAFAETQDKDSVDEAEENQDTKPAIFASVSSELSGENAVSVIAVFNNVNGQSGKLRIKSGRKLGLKCVCMDEKVKCDTAFSDINKKYVPGQSKPAPK